MTNVTGGNTRVSIRMMVIAVLAVALSHVVPTPAEAIDLHRRWMVGVRLADYLPADEVTGGFRVSTQALGTRSENDVKLGESAYPSLSLSYGVKKWARKSGARDVHMTLEFTAGRFSTGVGDETGFIDENASSRLALPDGRQRGPDGDETFEVFPLGDIDLMPVFVNALFHWGSPRADFYAGAGLGMVFVDFQESSEYRAFLADFDGEDDVRAKDAMALNLKLGSNVRLTRNDRWYLFFELEYFASQVLGSQPQVAWAGGSAFLGTRDYDVDGDGSLDVFGFPADYREVDPGKLRLDGASAGIGLRCRFGGGKEASAAAAE